MTPPALIFTVVMSFLLIRLPRKQAVVPLLMGASYMTLGQQIAVGPLHFTVIRILVVVGLFRVMIRGERISGGWKILDRMMVWWSICAVVSSFFHEEVAGALVFRMGMVYEGFGLYFLMRVFIQDTAGIVRTCKIVIIVLIPVAIEMIGEQLTGYNYFAAFGGESSEVAVRNGRFRAQGPFAHSILAGTVGAVCWPMALIFWKKNHSFALLGLATTGIIVLASRSSGPIMTSLFILLGLGLWRLRGHMRLVRWSAVLAIVVLNMMMEAPIYYLLARIDLTGSSTGWHRAELIHAAITHLGEWWFAGTDYTRHWIAYGVSWSKDHADITNYYIKLGVIGGLPLMLVFVGAIGAAFVSIGKSLRLHGEAPRETQFLIWILGSILFGHAATFLSVSYFDQSVVFLYLALAMIGSLPVKGRQLVPVSTPEKNWPRLEDEQNLCHHC